MLVNQKTIDKFIQIENRYEQLRFEKVLDIPMEMWETYEHFTSEPENNNKRQWQEVSKGKKWGDNWLTAWFKGDIILPSRCGGKKTFIKAKTDGETLFIVDGKYSGVFDDNHPVVMMTPEGVSGRSYHLAFEAYAGHHKPGAGADENDPAPTPGCRTFDGVELMLEREEVTGFVFDLRVLRQLTKILDDNSLRKNKIIKGLVKVFEIVDAVPAETPEEAWRPKLQKAREVMKPLLEAKNGSTTPFFGIVGHSHIDTAWLWPISETWRKCARTFSSVLNLMDQYPEFTFIQSAPYHTVAVKERYPELFERIKEKVTEGRWEPNGGMWVEPDCNIPSGESFIRQLLIGQKTTRELFGYTSDTLWLPDVFGYSAALPQILKGCRVEFFCTTKLAWNDTNRFPYDTFVWEGIDGTPIISHFNYIHCWPDPETLTQQWNNVQHKDVQDRRLTAIGYGDGGGGPMHEMIEVSRRVKDLEGSPKADYTTASEFMKGIRDDLEDLPVWAGELYLELHRGTLTSIAGIKRGNRKAEIAIRNAEFLSTIASLRNQPYPKKKLDTIWKQLLINQFHDILPGSSIAKVNDEAVESYRKLLKEIDWVCEEALTFAKAPVAEDKKFVLIINNLNWSRSKGILLDDIPEGFYIDGDHIESQWISDIEGNKKLAVSGINIPALGSKILPLNTNKQEETESSFVVGTDEIETPFASIKFDEIGRIVYLLDKKSGRNVVKPGGALNTFWLGEDVPNYWDSWDIDSDQSLKMEIVRGFIHREVVADGSVQLRLRSTYDIGENSHLIQDMILYSDTARIDFETKIDWAEKHKLLKSGFEVDVFATEAKHEIQYGYVERPTHRNLPQDRARFEVCNHKWTDISEAGFGVALLNDCKYGIGVQGSDMRLSLMKSGIRPDPRGDEGTHFFTYSILPHEGSFSVENVVRSAYELNMPVISTMTGEEMMEFDGIVEVDAPNIIIESIKWAEDGAGFVLRLYDAEKTSRNVNITFNVPVKNIKETDMLEEDKKDIHLDQNTLSLYIKAFEIKTLYITLEENS